MASKKVEQKITLLQSGDVKARKDAALWLGRKGIQDAFFPLLTALRDRDWKVRRNAAIALGSLGNRDAVESLVAALTDQTLSVKRAAIQSLGALRDMRATESLIRFHNNMQLGSDALAALMQIGAPALLYCAQQIQSESLTARNLSLGAARQMVRWDACALLRETMSIEDWNGQQRWLALETVRSIQSSLTLFEIWLMAKSGRIHFIRITDVPNWCERITRAPELSELHAGSRQVLDYIMLGRASQRDHAIESEELLRAATGTTHSDTGQTLLRASDRSATVPEKPVLMDRLRRWLAARSRKILP
ncbi:MAG: hypothetical protein JWN14_2434 [Chthonomonadales bacterium]|nr:hypothetical protein [Chthonomonadales bacterium]